MSLFTKLSVVWAINLALTVSAIAQNAYQQQFAPQYENEWTRRAEQLVQDSIEKSLTPRDGKWYVKFTINATRPVREHRGFSVPIPLNSEPISREGFLEFTDIALPAKTSSLKRYNTDDWWVGATVRLRGFRVYDPKSGWSEGRQVLAILEWEGEVKSGVLSLVSKNDQQFQTSDSGITSFVASVFNMPVDQVRCMKPHVTEIPKVAAQNNRIPSRAKYN